MWYILKPILVILLTILSLIIFLIGNLFLIIFVFKPKKYYEWFVSYKYGRLYYSDNNPIDTFKRHWNSIS